MTKEPEVVTIPPVASEAKPKCGIVMPIADFAPYPLGHWIDVENMIKEAVADVGFSGRVVSSKDAVGVIQAHIVQNLFDDPIVVVDVSGKNPNVMFELGMRLAFDKPVVIIKDELTDYTFDAGPVEHLKYRSDLRYQSIVAFKQELAAKVRATHKARDDKDHATFLKQFGRISTASLGEKEGSALELVLSEMESLRSEMRSLGRSDPPSVPLVDLRRSIKYRLNTVLDRDAFAMQMAKIMSDVEVDRISYENVDGGFDVTFYVQTKAGRAALMNRMISSFPASVILQ